MYSGGQPILVLREGTERKSGKGAQFNNIAAAKAIADAVRTTLGPKGMDKMLVDSMGDVVITKDGVTILKEVDVEHPAAKMVIEVAKTQDEQCGDGTTTAVIFAGELLKLAENLVEKNIHPTLITEGYRMAADKAVDVLKGMALKVGIDDDANLRNIALTSLRVSEEIESFSPATMAMASPANAVPGLVTTPTNRVSANIEFKLREFNVRERNL